MAVANSQKDRKQILINLPTDRRESLLLPEDLDQLGTLGDLVFFDPSKPGADLPALLNSAQVMLTSWGSQPLSVENWQQRDTPLLVAHAAGSVRHLVPRDLLTRGLRLTHSPSSIAPAVAQYTVGLMILALRQAFARSDTLRRGENWNGSPVYHDLEGLMVGLVGLSQVGRRVPPLLATFGCRVLAYDPYWTAEAARQLGVMLVQDLDELVPIVDVLSLHAPVTPETQNLLNERRIARLKPGAVVINTARAALVDQDALLARAFAGEIEAYLDVTTPEPLPSAHPAWACPHLFITPHIAGGTRQSKRRIVQHTISEIERFFTGQPLLAEVTLDRYDILA